MSGAGNQRADDDRVGGPCVEGLHAGGLHAKDPCADNSRANNPCANDPCTGAVINGGKTPINAQVAEKDALRYLGHKGQPLGEDLAVAFQNAVTKVSALQATGVAKQFPVSCVNPEGVWLAETSLVLPGSHIARHVGTAQAVLLLAVTLGFACERLLRQAACVNAVQGLMADACASSMVENAAEVFSDTLAYEVASQGFTCGKRFSPGYGDFPLSVQPAFLEALGATKTLGIQVTPGDLMVPTKSITAVIPLYAKQGEQRDGGAATEGVGSAEKTGVDTKPSGT